MHNYNCRNDKKIIIKIYVNILLEFNGKMYGFAETITIVSARGYTHKIWPGTAKRQKIYTANFLNSMSECMNSYLGEIKRLILRKPFETIRTPFYFI